MRIVGRRYQRGTGWSGDLPDVDSPRTLVLVFASPGYRDAPGPLLELLHRYPSSCVVGCSTAGEIANGAVADESIAVAIARFERATLRVATSPVDGPGSYAAGRRLAEALDAPDLRFLLVLSEGVDVDGTGLIQGLDGVLGRRVAIAGGLAGDGVRMRSTWVLSEGELRERAAVGVGVYGETVRVGSGSRGGWQRFGPERLVTRSRGNVVYELDGVPALDVYERFLGDRVDGLPASALLFPLAIGTGRGPHVVRTILGIDPVARALRFAGSVPEGSRGHLMRASVDDLLAGATIAAREARERTPSPALALAISCVGRRLVLGSRVAEEVEATLRELPAGTEQIGFYANGEIAPSVDDVADLHNQTMTVATLSE